MGYFSKMDDIWMIRFLSQYTFEGPYTLSQLMLVSHAFHQFCSWDHMWLKVSLNMNPGHFQYEHSWRFTAKKIWLTKQKEQREIKNGQIEPPLQLTPLPWTPISGFYSPKMFRRWFRAQTPLQGMATDPGVVPRVQRLTEEEFTLLYDRPRRPCILTDICYKWEAFTQWSPDNLVKMFPNHILKCSQSNMKGNRVKITVSNFVQYMRAQTDSNPLYVFDSKFYRRIPELEQHYSVPSLFWQDWFSLFGIKRPSHRWFLMGPARSGTPFHIDPTGTAAWNALLYGQKKWYLYPPDAPPPGVYYNYLENGNIKDFKAPSILKWLFDVYPFLSPQQRPIEFVQQTGEMVYVPAGWWHAVVNISETVSVTHNFVNDQNLELSTTWLWNQGERKMLSVWLEKMKEISKPHYFRVRNKIRNLERKEALEQLEKYENKGTKKKEGESSSESSSEEE
uniref:JmjC domain-containing protein n=1 Tax=Arcella intermedia TaxID=1963864 RepID=A0A6B2L3R4_9EUKA